MNKKKSTQGTWIRLNPDVRSMMNMILGLTQKSQTRYVSDLVEEDVANKLSGIEGIEDTLEAFIPGLSAGYQKLLKRVAFRQSGGTMPPDMEEMDIEDTEEVDIEKELEEDEEPTSEEELETAEIPSIDLP